MHGYTPVISLQGVLRRLEAFSRPGAAGVVVPDAKVLASAVAPLDAKKWARDLPNEIRRSSVNYSGGAIEIGSSNLGLASLLEMLEQAGIERGETDVLVVDDSTTLKGTVACGPLSIDTSYGTAKLSLDEIAVVGGAAGQGGPTRVFLRNGEVLVGKLSAPDFVLDTNSGLKVDLVPELLKMLVLRVSPRTSNAWKDPTPL